MQKPQSAYIKKKSQQGSYELPSYLTFLEKIGEGAFGEVLKVIDQRDGKMKVVKRCKDNQGLGEEEKVWKELWGEQQEKNNATINENSMTNGLLCCANSQVLQGSYELAPQPYRSSNIRLVANSPRQGLNYQVKPINPLSERDSPIFVEQLPSLSDSCAGSLLMTHFGPNFDSIVSSHQINSYSLKRIAKQLISQLESLHAKGYVHRDIKPGNIVLGNSENPHKVFLIDFGLAGRYPTQGNGDWNNRKNKPKDYDGLMGTARFCPVISHYGIDQSPWDDMESLGYILCFLYSKRLPWFNSQPIQDDRYFIQIRAEKEQSSIEVLSAGLNCLRLYWEHLRSVQKVDYSYLSNLMNVGQLNDSDCLSFCGQICRFLQRVPTPLNHEAEQLVPNQPRAHPTRKIVI